MKKKAFDDIDNVAANCELHMTVVDLAKQVYYSTVCCFCCSSFVQSVVYSCSTANNSIHNAPFSAICHMERYKGLCYPDAGSCMFCSYCSI